MAFVAIKRFSWLVAVVALAPTALPALRGQEPAVPSPLNRVPHDAAMFVHLNFAEFWKSPFGQTLRTDKASGVDQLIRELAVAFAIQPEMIQTVTVCFPKIKKPEDTSAFSLGIALTKPYDQAETSKRFLAMLEKDGIPFENKNGLIQYKNANRSFRVQLNQPNLLALSVNLAEDYSQPRPAGETGVLSKILQQAPSNTLTLGANWAQLPDELRGKDLPPEVRPFRELLNTESLLLTGKLIPKGLDLALTFQGRAEQDLPTAEKSVQLGVQVLKQIVDLGINSLGQGSKEEANAALPFLKTTLKILENTKVSRQDTAITAKTLLPNDYPYAAAVGFFLGGSLGIASDRNETMNNLKQIGLAMHNYHDAHGHFPPAAICDKDGKPLLSWRVALLPYLNQEALYKQFKLDEPWDSENNRKLADIVLKIYQVPGLNDNSKRDCHIRLFTGNGAAFETSSGTKIRQFTDGTSNTALVFVTQKAVPWSKPDDVSFDPKAKDLRTLLAWPGDVTPVLFADGSVRVLKKTIDPKVLRAIITRAGGEVVNDE